MGVKRRCPSDRGGILVIAGFRDIVGLVATCVLFCACGPSSVIDRVYQPTSDAAAPARDGPISLPGSMQPTPNNPPPGVVDPIGLSEGFACKDGTECRSGFCADGVCCTSTCEGSCQACDQEGKLGRCLPVPDGQDPDDECAEEPITSCGRDGACDGAGACRRYPAGMVCVPGGCDNATERSARLCDGKGTCSPTMLKNCAPAECLGDACGPPCMMDPDCPAGRWCDKGTCRTQREQGMPCDRNTQCGTGHCTDGVCCNMECKDGCYSCDQVGSLGVCKAVPDGQDPGAECPVQPIGNCGNAGGCNGRGACRKHPTGTFCGYGACMNGMQFGNSTCDGMGGCRRGPGRSCAPYACNGNLICWHVCSTAAQCAPGRRCNVHTCQ